MKKLIIIIVAIGFSIATLSVNASERWVCQVCDPIWQNTYSTISAAIAAASAGDTIIIYSEESQTVDDTVIEYDEHIVINKEITLTATDGDYGYAVVKQTSFATNNEVIEITEAGSGSEITNLIIKGPIDDNTGCSFDPLSCMDDKVGIRLEGDNCLINNCEITFCMTGIFMESTTGSAGTGNTISNCIIGDRWWKELAADEYIYEEYWTDVSGSTDIDYPGNGFGVVLVAPTWSRQVGEDQTIWTKNEIVDCVIRSNRYYGVVLTNGSHAHVAHNIIAWNGDNDTVALTTIPVKTGGILSLFTATQIASNDNKLQAPTILSNTIYGNKGYQIGIFTEEDDPRHIYNSPVIMSNNIGTEDNMPLATPGHADYDYLICCGPTPNVTVTPTPVQTPEATATPCLHDFDYDFHGSSAYLAWNNLNDTSLMGLEIYHPLQEHNAAPRQTFTPTPTNPPTNTPTPTGFETYTPTPRPFSTVAPFSLQPTPQGVSWSPTPTPPTPSPTFTPRPRFHQLDDFSWRMRHVQKDPLHYGWVEDGNRVPPLYYDWHLRDFDPTGTQSTPTPFSSCFNKGGFPLVPGAAVASNQDIGFVDLGKHVKSLVPPVENISLTLSGSIYTLSWDQPEYWGDGSLFKSSHVGGYVVLFGKETYEGSGIFQRIVVVPIGSPIYVPSTQTSYTVGIGIPRGSTHMGVYLYDVQDNASVKTWHEFP